jgi:hypothetical protein
MYQPNIQKVSDLNPLVGTELKKKKKNSKFVSITTAKHTETKIQAAPETVYTSNVIQKINNIQHSTGKKALW